MENSLINTKLEIIEWVTHLDDLQVIEKLIKIKNNEKKYSVVAEAQSEYLVKDNFEEQWERGLALEESRTASKEKIRGWWGK